MILKNIILSALTLLITNTHAMHLAGGIGVTSFSKIGAPLRHYSSKNRMFFFNLKNPKLIDSLKGKNVQSILAEKQLAAFKKQPLVKPSITIITPKKYLTLSIKKTTNNPQTNTKNQINSITSNTSNLYFDQGSIADDAILFYAGYRIGKTNKDEENHICEYKNNSNTNYESSNYSNSTDIANDDE